MSTEQLGSVTGWLRGLEGDDSDAAQNLWDRYFGRLLQRAKTLLEEKQQHRLDGEDIVVDVMTSLWKGARDGRFKDVRNRDELWWLLLAITRMTLVDGIRKGSAQKRGGLTKTYAFDGEDPGRIYAQLVSGEPSPEDALMLAEEVSRLLSLLPDEKSRGIAVHWLEGCTQQEIAQRTDVSTATVTRKLRLIRQIWKAELL